MPWGHRCVVPADVDDDRGFLAKTTLLFRLSRTVRKKGERSTYTS